MQDSGLHNALLSLVSGNMDALDTIYRLTNRKVFAVALNILGQKSDAEDAVQETYGKICDFIHSYVRSDNPEGWVCRIAKNTALDILRKKKNDVQLEQLENVLAAGQTGEDDDGSVRAAYREVLKAANICLDEGEREILLLHTVGGMKHKKIAEALGKPYATIRWTYAQAVAKVRAKLKETGVSL
jgi:RNA polymerase sigma-70 factor (ECF subfamily)